jgi:hypothetical protein
MKWIYLIVAGAVCSLALSGPGGSLTPSTAAAADSVQLMASQVNQFMCDPHVTETFLSLAREDKEFRLKSRKDSPAWLKAKGDPHAFLTMVGVTVPENIEVRFSFSMLARGKGLYCIDSCINPHGGRCTSCAHPEKTGCIGVRHCYPLSSL